MISLPDMPAPSAAARLVDLLAHDLDFHDSGDSCVAHTIHSFPAKFPPQLPQKFIHALTQPGQVVLDPMAGSGTTPLEAYLAGRQAIGFDIDPLALLLAQVKTTPLPADIAQDAGMEAAARAQHALRRRPDDLARFCACRWNEKSRRFIDYWFAPTTQFELAALIKEIEAVPAPAIRAFLLAAFSATIIARSRGVSLAVDLAHTRPHRVQTALSPAGTRLFTATASINGSAHSASHQTKIIYPALAEFRRRVQVQARALLSLLPSGGAPAAPAPLLSFGNAQALPLPASSVDLIVTSPPYAGNAIDYMRAHKFSLVWMGHAIDRLGQQRKQYIGDESLPDIPFDEMPPYTAGIIAAISRRDARKSQILHRYYAEMTTALREMHRVLRPGAAAILVVGSAVMRGQDTETHRCLAEIGETLGFTVPDIGLRRLDRNRRMMPAANQHNPDSAIQRRMHEEYVIGLCKA